MYELIPIQVDIVEVSRSVNGVFVLVASFLVFFMQPGFALLEVGQVRSKNVANVAMKNLVDWSQGVLTYFLIGSGVAYLVGSLTSPGPVSLSGAFVYLNEPTAWIGWLFGAVFAMTAATIVSGAVAGRIKFKTYVIFGFVMVAVIYPVVQGFVWEGGLLSAEGFVGRLLGTGYIDFAGATVVHMVGGVAGLVAAARIGPRQGRFDGSEKQVIPGHSVFLTMLGTFVLAFGWYGFNVGTQMTVLTESGSFNGAALGRTALNTTLGMGAGTLAAAALTTVRREKPDPVFSANGMLAGLVAVTGAAGHVTWWGSIALGALGGSLVVPVYHWTVSELRIDDVCGVFAVHGVSGAVGTLLIPLFAVGTNGEWQLLGPNQFLMQAVGITVIALWTGATTLLALGGIHRLLGVDLRVGTDDEQSGLDASEHNIMAYPEFAVTDGGDSRRDEDINDSGAEKRQATREALTTNWRGQEVEISRKTEYEQELEALTTRFQLALEETDTGVWELDLDTDAVFWDEASERLFGYDPGEFPGTYDAFASHVDEDTLEEIETELQTAIERDCDYEAEFEITLPDGGVRWIQARGVVSRDGTGAPDRMLGIQTDITERRQREEKLKRAKRTLKQSNERLEQFAGVVSHDLRNPLMVALARVDAIRDDAPDEHVETMERNLERMESMIDDLLTLARTGNGIKNPQPVSLASVATEAWSHVRVDDGKLEVALPAEATVEADDDRLLQVFENLFRNAFDHNSPPLTIRVGALGTGPPLSGFYVADDGGGFPATVSTETLFEHGYTNSGDSSGFGLAIVRDVVEAHGWDITACESDTGGARFEVALDGDD